MLSARKTIYLYNGYVYITEHRYWQLKSSCWEIIAERIFFQCKIAVNCSQNHTDEILGTQMVRGGSRPESWGRSFCKKKITNFLDPPLKTVIRWESLEVKVATWTIIKFYKSTASNFTGQEISGTNEPLWHHWANRKPLTVHHQRLPLIKWNLME